MQWIAAILYYSIIVPISWLPLPILYLKSNALSFVLFRIFRYRKNIIKNNITHSFPNKTATEIKVIIRAFEKHFMRIFFAETIKSASISRKEIHQRLTFKNPEILSRYFEKGENVILSMGHFGNWEWITYCPQFEVFQHSVGALYKVQKPISDYIMLKIRSRNGADLVPSEKVVNYFKTEHKKPTTLLFIGDQSPHKPQYAYWTQFLNRETGVINGTERMAQRYGWPVVYCAITPTKPGYYEMHFETVCDEPKSSEPGEITELCTRLLEKDIQETPYAWLWSHKRWKHKKPVSNG